MKLTLPQRRHPLHKNILNKKLGCIIGSAPGKLFIFLSSYDNNELHRNLKYLYYVKINGFRKSSID